MKRLANFSLTTKPINGQEMVKEIKEKVKAFFNTTTTSLQVSYLTVLCFWTDNIHHL